MTIEQTTKFDNTWICLLKLLINILSEKNIRDYTYIYTKKHISCQLHKLVTSETFKSWGGLVMITLELPKFESHGWLATFPYTPQYTTANILLLVRKTKTNLSQYQDLLITIPIRNKYCSLLITQFTKKKKKN